MSRGQEEEVDDEIAIDDGKAHTHHSFSLLQYHHRLFSTVLCNDMELFSLKSLRIDRENTVKLTIIYSSYNQCVDNSDNSEL
jgi:hypothetical protein